MPTGSLEQQRILRPTLVIVRPASAELAEDWNLW